jgi:hypothetical protein
MPNHLSTLGIIHTAISILALIAGFIALFRDGKIKPAGTAGKWYVILTVLTCLTAYGLLKNGKITPGIVLATVVLILLLIGGYAHRFFGASGEKVQVICMSMSLMLSFIPAITESLTRLPISSPIAASPDTPVVEMCYLGLLIVFVIGLTYQLRKLRKHKVA